jgi:hypothetical protein
MSNDTTLIGRAKELEVASLLISNDLYVFFPFVDNGFDLIVGNKDCSKLIPIQVKYRKTESSLCLQKKDVSKFKGKDVLLVYLIGVGENQQIWLIPFLEWESRSSDRGRKDERIYVEIQKNSEFLMRFKGECGISALKQRLDMKTNPADT